VVSDVESICVFSISCLRQKNLLLSTDFSRAVRKNHGWDVKRIAATPEEKKKFRENRKGKVYFINVHYTVPGAASNNAKAKKPRAKKAKAPAKSNEDASRVLRDAISSAVESATGEVDANCLQRALDAGYSEHFILARAAEERGDGDQKPAAKKPSVSVPVAAARSLVDEGDQTSAAKNPR
jgi:hypothetical protein